MHAFVSCNSRNESFLSSHLQTFLFCRDAGDLNSMSEVKGSPVDMMVLLLDADENLVASSEPRDAKGVSCRVYLFLMWPLGLFL